MKLPRKYLRLEPLESRAVPAVFVNANTVTYKEADGDTVKVALSKPILKTGPGGNVDSIFKFNTGAVDGSLAPQVLQTLDLTPVAAAANGLNVTVSAVKADGTKSTADVGFINAHAILMGAVTVTGDLGRIFAGKYTYNAAGYPVPAVGLKLLSVGSLGSRGTATQGAGGDLYSHIVGHISAIKVAGDVVGATVSASYNISSVTVGGSVRAESAGDYAGSILAGGLIGPVKITGDLKGGGGASSGAVVGAGVASLAVGGDIVGGAGPGSGAVIVSGDMQKVIRTIRKVTREYGYTEVEIIEQTVNYRLVGGVIGSVSVGGNITGGAGAQSGSLISLLGSVGAVKIAGHLTGGTAPDAGAISAKSGTKSLNNGDIDEELHQMKTLGGHIGAVTVGGTVTGGSHPRTGAIIANGGSIKSVKIGGDLLGKAGEQSGAVIASGISEAVVARRSFRYMGYTYSHNEVVGFRLVGGVVGPVTVGGSVTGGGGKQSGAVGSTLGHVGPVTVTGRVVNKVLVGGAVTGGGGEESGAVFAKGKTESIPTEAVGDVETKVHLSGNVGAVSVAGSLTGAVGKASGSVTATGGSVKSVKIGGNLEGAVGENSGSVQAAGAAKPRTRRVTVREYGYTTTYTQTVGYTLVGGGVGPVTVGGSIVGGNGLRSGSVGSALGTVASVKVTGRVVDKVLVGGNVTGGGGDESGSVFAKAKEETVDVGVGKVAVGGTVGPVTVAGAVEGRAGHNSGSVVADVAVTAVTVGQTWTAANVAVGLSAGPDKKFGTGDDVITLPFLTAANNRVGSITIGGAVAGTASPPGSATDTFRFTARSFGAVKVNKAPLALTAGLDVIDIGATNDFKLVEFPVPVGP